MTTLNIQGILYKLCLLETLCFRNTDRNNRWSIINGKLSLR